jgi:hypothetical protein
MKIVKFVEEKMIKTNYQNYSYKLQHFNYKQLVCTKHYLNFMLNSITLESLSLQTFQYFFILLIYLKILYDCWLFKAHS